MDSVEDIITIISLHTMKVNSALQWENVNFSHSFLPTQISDNKVTAYNGEEPYKKRRTVHPLTRLL